MKPVAARLALAALLATWPAGAETVPIPPHPDALRYSQTPTRLPTVSGRRFELAAGPIVFLAEDHTLPLVEITLALPVGAFLDPPEKTGLSYLSTTQIRRAGAGAFDADTFDEHVDDLGARLDSVAGTTRSGASVSVPTWNLEAALDLFFAMLTAPRFESDRLASARSNLLESMSLRNVEPLDVLQREWQWLLYGEDHADSRPLTPTTLEAIRTEDLEDFHRRYWTPDRMILAVSGDLAPAGILAELERRFAAWPAADSRQPLPWPPPAPATAAAPGLYHYEFDTPQTKVLLGRRLPQRLTWSARDRFILEVLAEILGGQGAISRIAGRLRTAEGLVYRAAASLDPGALWPGELQVFFETQGPTTARAVAAAVAEIERLRREPVHPRELEVVQQTLIARLRLSLDTAEEIAGYFAEDELLDRPFTYRQDYLDTLGSVTTTEIQEVARTHLDSQQFLFLTVGRWREIGGGAPAGDSALERAVGRPMTPLAARDPLTLEPVATD